MDLNEARQIVLSSAEETPNSDLDLSAFSDEETSPHIRAVRFANIAASLGMWNEAEVLIRDPALDDSPFSLDEDGINMTLGMQASKMGELDKAREYFEVVENPTYDLSVHILDAMIVMGELKEAERIIRKADFSIFESSGPQKRLAGLVRQMCKAVDGPKEALGLVMELVPEPGKSGTPDDIIERSRLDYFVRPIAPSAVAQKDFLTAESAIELIDRWYKPRARGGPSLLSVSYDFMDQNVSAAIEALILRRWGQGPFNLNNPTVYSNIDDDTRLSIIDWLQDTKEKFTAHEYTSPSSSLNADGISRAIDSFSR